MELKKSLKPRRFYAFIYLSLISILLVSQEPASLLLVAIFSVAAFRSYKRGNLKFEDLNITMWHAYNSKSYYKLISDYEDIESFDEVKNWDNQAQNEISNMNTYNQDLEIQVQSANQNLIQFKANLSTLPFFKKTFRYRTQERFISHYINYLNSLRVSSWHYDLQNKIDFSPNNKDEQKLILSKLQESKDELNLEIKNIAYDIKDVKENARIRNAEINSSLFSTPKSRRLNREANSRNKNNQLVNLEKQKRSITQKVHDIDKQILWVKRIKESKKTSSLDMKAS